VDQELVEYLDRRFNEFRVALREELRADLRADIEASAAETRAVLRAEMAATAAETRRHFDVVTEQLTNKIQLVGEGVIGVDQKVDRLAAETRAGFEKVDRRILHLQARVLGRD
jgi:hypothetical protein